MRKYLFLLCFLIPVLSFSAVSYQQLFDHYFSLSNALADDSVPNAKKAAKELATTVALLLEEPSKKKDPIKKEDLPKDETETVRQALATLSHLSRTIQDVNKLDQMRKPFEELTAVVAGLQTHTKIQADEYYCPMVKKIWLQPKDSKKIRNPYMGKSMVDCGEKRKTVSR